MFEWHGVWSGDPCLWASRRSGLHQIGEVLLFEFGIIWKYDGPDSRRWVNDNSSGSCFKPNSFWFPDNEPIGGGEPRSESTSTSTSTTSTTTARPTSTSTYKPTTPASTLPPKKSGGSSTTISTPTHYLSTTAKPFDELIDDDEYEYEDDYLTTDGKDLQNYQDSSGWHDDDRMAWDGPGWHELN